APVRRPKRRPALPDSLRLTLPSPRVPFPQQSQHRPAPSRTGESGAERAGPPRCGDDGIELRRAAVVQPPAGFVGLVEQLTEALQVPAGEELRAEPSAGGLADDVKRAGTERLG